MEATIQEKKKVKRKIKQDTEYEKCVLCGKQTMVAVNDNVLDRQYYVEGSGQLCKECYEKLYMPSEAYFKEEIEKYKNSIHFDAKPVYELFRRTIDVLFSLVMIIPSSILIILFSIIIRLESQGNPIFSQVRVGKNGKLIKIHKLRSMRNDAEANGQKWADNDDPRITKVGKFIRKHRIDELPQMFDVLIGRMSLIGPRPEVPALTKQFNEENPGFVTRLMVTPGLSGWAQINGGYDLLPREKWIRDNEYIENRSIKMYVKIFYLTIKTVLFGDGAR